VTQAYRPFNRVLVANRGEIATRLLQGIRNDGLTAIAVASEADAHAVHALAADRTVVIGPGPAAESYLDVERVLAAAHETGAEAIHPGYGFLAENGDFAQAVLDAGLVWIGPPPAVIRQLGDKMEAKAIAEAAGVPTCPGYQGSVDDADAVAAAAAAIGYPVLVKAAAGGGGRGMRVVPTASELAGALESAAREALGAFGSDRVFLEKFVEPARHVEIQILADAHGNVVHLGERECSVQRRHQKVVEEAPSCVVDADLRERMGAAAVSLAKASGYVGAGTVEFLLAPDGAFYFLEVNTRLQVEHPVTELVTGIDLASAMLRVAAGEPLAICQDDIAARGHAIEVRVCAEDPALRFAPQAGRILHLELPSGPGVRVDSGFRTGSDVPPLYDSLLMKLIAYGPTRDAAIRRTLSALDDLVILGLKTNVAYLKTIVDHPAFRSGDLSTGFIAEHLADWKPAETDLELALAVAVVAESSATSSGGRGAGPGTRTASPWETVGSFLTVGEPGRESDGASS